jgi:hypothetical protein
VIVIAVRRGVDHVSDAIAGRNSEQSVHGIEDFARNDHVPLAKQATSVLTLLVLEHDVESVLPLLGIAAVELTE